MSQYMLLVYEEELDEAGQAERDRDLPLLAELHRSLRDAGLLKAVRALHSVESATSVRVREGQPELTDGPFAVTKEVLAGFYLLECADLDEAIKQAERLPQARWGRSRCARPARSTTGCTRRAPPASSCRTRT